MGSQDTTAGPASSTTLYVLEFALLHELGKARRLRLRADEDPGDGCGPVVCQPASSLGSKAPQHVAPGPTTPAT